MTTSGSNALVEHLFRHHAGRITARLAREFGVSLLDAIEDAVQEAMIQALKHWPYQGVPDRPDAWITRVAKNRMLDTVRRQRTWQQKQPLIQTGMAEEDDTDEILAGFSEEVSDDQLSMMFACCHPEIAVASQVALTLKVVCGFSIAEIAQAFLTSKPAMAQRVIRAKRQLLNHKESFGIPSGYDLSARIDAVLQAIYLMFNEGYSAGSGDELIRQDLCHEAIRLANGLIAHEVLAQPKIHALLALMLFQAARFSSRTDEAGDLVLLAEQDRQSWDQRLIRQGAQQLRLAASGHSLSTYHLEAEISACHATAACYEQTDWPRILLCYDHLLRLNASPVIAVNRAVAVLQVHGAESALAALSAIEQTKQLEHYYPFYVARAHALAELNQHQSARQYYEQALNLAQSAPVRRFLLRKLNKEHQI